MPKIGGKRPGAGRKPGSKNMRSRALAERLIGEGYDPDILVKIGFKVAADPKTKPSEKIYAIATVLPFLVPKLSAVAMDLVAEVDLDEPKNRKAARAVLDALFGKDA